MLWKHGHAIKYQHRYLQLFGKHSPYKSSSIFFHSLADFIAVDVWKQFFFRNKRKHCWLWKSLNQCNYVCVNNKVSLFCGFLYVGRKYQKFPTLLSFVSSRKGRKKEYRIGWVAVAARNLIKTFFRSFHFYINKTFIDTMKTRRFTSIVERQNIRNWTYFSRFIVTTCTHQKIIVQANKTSLLILNLSLKFIFYYDSVLFILNVQSRDLLFICGSIFTSNE